MALVREPAERVATPSLRVDTPVNAPEERVNTPLVIPDGIITGAAALEGIDNRD